MSPGTLRSCSTTHDVARVMEKIAPPDRTAELFRGVCDSLRDYREESERTINTLRSEVERLTVENEELKAESRASYNTKPIFKPAGTRYCEAGHPAGQRGCTLCEDLI